jgi:uncharacterized protein YigE (DUF2233 family)
MKRLFQTAVIWLVSFSTLRAVEFKEMTFVGKRFTVCRVDVLKDRVSIGYQDDQGKVFQRFDRLASWVEARGEKLAFAMNAGMYHRDFKSVGLLVREGATLAPLNLEEGQGNFFMKPNGVFAIRESGALVVDATAYEKTGVKWATQSGPQRSVKALHHV